MQYLAIFVPSSRSKFSSPSCFEDSVISQGVIFRFSLHLSVWERIDFCKKILECLSIAKPNEEVTEKRFYFIFITKTETIQFICPNLVRTVIAQNIMPLSRVKPNLKGVKSIECTFASWQDLWIHYPKLLRTGVTQLRHQPTVNLRTKHF